MDTAALHPMDGSRSRLSEGWDAVPLSLAVVDEVMALFNTSDELVSHDFHMDLVLQ